VLLYAGPLSRTARQRLKIIFENTDGFEIARQDLQLRGPGEFVGSRQSGVPLLRYADLEMDADLVEWRAVAEEMLIKRGVSRDRKARGCLVGPLLVAVSRCLLGCLAGCRRLF
jgi:RecG-like helicase